MSALHNQPATIRSHHRSAFNALLSGQFANFALVSCYVDGEPACAIALIEQQDEEVQIKPLFVSITDAMTIADHDGRAS